MTRPSEVKLLSDWSFDLTAWQIRVSDRLWKDVGAICPPVVIVNVTPRVWPQGGDPYMVPCSVYHETVQNVQVHL